MQGPAGRQHPTGPAHRAEHQQAMSIERHSLILHYECIISRFRYIPEALTMDT